MSKTELLKDGTTQWRGTVAEAVVEHRHCWNCGTAYTPRHDFRHVECPICHEDADARSSSSPGPLTTEGK